MTPNARFTDFIKDISPSPTTNARSASAHNAIRDALRSDSKYKVEPDEARRGATSRVQSIQAHPARAWHDRAPRRRSLRREAFAALPAHPYTTVLRLERRLSRDGMVSVEGNEYSVPDTLARRTVEVHRLAEHLHTYDAGQLIAVHPVLEGRGQRRVAEEYRHWPPPGTSISRMRNSYKQSRETSSDGWRRVPLAFANCGICGYQSVHSRQFQGRRHSGQCCAQVSVGHREIPAWTCLPFWLGVDRTRWRGRTHGLEKGHPTPSQARPSAVAICLSHCHSMRASTSISRTGNASFAVSPHAARVGSRA